MSAPIVQWICREMSRLLGFEATDDIARYILAIETKSDVQDYIYELLDPKVPQNKKFVTQLLQKWTPPERKVDYAIPSNVQVYKKGDDAEEFKTNNDKSFKANKKKSKKITGNNGVPVHSNFNNNAKQNHPSNCSSQNMEVVKNTDTSTGAVKKTKFVPLFSDKGHAQTVARLPGRYSCECLATKHNLVNNCVKCGRIVCQQEGSGPCLFCGNLVCTNEEMEILARGSKKSDKLRQQLMGTDPKNSKDSYDSLPNISSRIQEGLEKAKQHRDKLVDYDKTSVKRTHVIDDQSDYFATDSRWVNQKEKEILQKREEEKRAQRFASRKDRKVTLDFAGRQVLDSNETFDMYSANDSVIQSVHFDHSGKGKSDPVFTDEDFADLVNPAIKSQPPQYIESKWASKNKRKPADSDGIKKSSRIQDRQILEMSDEGMCMSMHQPWASLLIKGIKKHEGRTWYTQHRGRLWIAATVKPPQPHEIAQVEHQHTQHYNDPDIDFPKDYPVGCLLGCVDVVDCPDQEEYLQQFPNGESGSPYVFICENPQELIVKFPMKGKHKIYKLDNHIHQGAKKGIRPS